MSGICKINELSDEMQIIPVLDIMNGQVVRGVAGDRANYTPIRSALVDSCEPETVARALIRATGTDTIYIANLDMLRWGTSEFDIRILPEWNGTIFLDAGGLGREPPDARFREIAAFEVGARSEFVRESFQQHRAVKPPAFSVDLRDGLLVGAWAEWGLRTPKDALGLVDRVWEIGFRTVIVLDVARVGVGSGTGTEALCAAIRERYPAMEIITGGGIRNWDDVNRLADCGIDGVLVASAIHDGTLKFPGDR